MTLPLSNSNLPLNLRNDAANAALEYMNALIRVRAFELKAHSKDRTDDDLQNFDEAQDEAKRIHSELQYHADILAGKL